jgi:hypothetical protein
MAKGNVSIKDSSGVLVTSGHIDTAGGDVLIGGQKVTNIYQNPDYAALVEQIKDYEELFEVALDQEKRLRYSQKIQDLKKRKKDFERQVIQMAETFLQIADDSSERLQQARAYFEQGDLKGASALLDVQTLEEEQEKLLKSLERAEEKLRTSAHEFLVKAQATALDFDNPNRFEDCCAYFEKSLKSRRLYENLYAYGIFLATHVQLDKGMALLNECLPLQNDSEQKLGLHLMLSTFCLQKQDFDGCEQHLSTALQIHQDVPWESADVRDLKKAEILLTLGFLYNTVNRDDEAMEIFNESLAIRERLAQKDPDNYGKLAMPALNHRGFLFYEHKAFAEAQQDFEKALHILETHKGKLPTESMPGMNDLPSSKETAKALLWHNLALVYMVTNPDVAEQYSQKAIETLAPLVRQNPFMFEPTHALILNGLGMFHLNSGDLDKAEGPLKESAQIYGQLAKLDPQAFEGHWALFMNNWALWYARSGRYDEAIPIFEQALAIYRRRYAETPAAFQGFMALVLQNLGESKCYAKDVEGGLALLNESKEHYRYLSETTPEATSGAFVLCTISLGMINAMTGNGAAAVGHWRDALSLCANNAEKNPTLYLPMLQIALENLDQLLEHSDDTTTKEAMLWALVEELKPMTKPFPNLQSVIKIATDRLLSFYTALLNFEEESVRAAAQENMAKLEAY